MGDYINLRQSFNNLPLFFPTIGWPGGRGEYDYLFKNLKYFCEKINHYHFLFNFSSFIFGFTIPNKDFNSEYEKYKNKDLAEILIDNTSISKSIAKKITILLDIGGNRIFNKIVKDNLPIYKVEAYIKYLIAYRDFIKSSNVDIFVSFEIGPSYTTKDEISKKGINIWNELPIQEKQTLNNKLLDISIKFKKKNQLIMVPINAENVNLFCHHLNYLYDNYSDSIDIIGIAGIANKSPIIVGNALSAFSAFKNEKKWNVLSHGLGLGGWLNIPLIIKYDINSCDVASPWRRACTNSVSQPYFPLFDKNLNFTTITNSFSHSELYDEIYSKIKCKCPFCEDLQLDEIKKRCKNADKRIIGTTLHGEDFREMRIRVYFHNTFQHIALLKKLFQYKSKYGEYFFKRFLDDMPQGTTKKRFLNLPI